MLRWTSRRADIDGRLADVLEDMCPAHAACLAILRGLGRVQTLHFRGVLQPYDPARYHHYCTPNVLRLLLPERALDDRGQSCPHSPSGEGRAAEGISWTFRDAARGVRTIPITFGVRFV